jgi:hypothetical protein
MARADKVRGTVRVDAADEKERERKRVVEKCEIGGDTKEMDGPGGAERRGGSGRGWDGSVVIMISKSTLLTPLSILTSPSNNEQFKLSRRESQSRTPYRRRISDVITR